MRVIVRKLAHSKNFILSFILIALVVIIFLAKSFHNQYIIMPAGEYANTENVDVDVNCKILVNSTYGGKLIIVLKTNKSLDINFIEAHSSEGRQILSKNLELKLNPEERKEITFSVDDFNSEIINHLLISREIMIKIILVSPNGMKFERNVRATVSFDGGCKSCPASLS